ncbi:OsmC family protein [Paenibacillus yanchengensis]|uniref:OsmC family protein n=1 Tax=Paenibacillus yanchengensis TaxID=2035833 RepID=A0ABW4YG16_9BACL
MTTLKIVDGQDQLFNEAGMQVVGSHRPNGQGLSPRELLESALALCISISMQQIMDYDGITYEKSAIVISIETEKAEEKPSRFAGFVAKVSLPPGLTDEYKEKLMRVTKRACTIGTTLCTGASVEMLVVE